MSILRQGNRRAPLATVCAILLALAAAGSSAAPAEMRDQAAGGGAARNESSSREAATGGALPAETHRAAAAGRREEPRATAGPALGGGRAGRAAGLLPVALTVTNTLDQARAAEPVTFGVPLAIGEGILGAAELDLRRSGQSVQAQKTVLSRWGGAPDDPAKPIQWLLLDFQADVAPLAAVEYTLLRAAPPPPASPLEIVSNDAQRLVVETGAARFTLSKTNFRLFDQVELAGGKVFGPGSGIRLGLIAGGPVTVTVDEEGSERIGVSLRGSFPSGLRYTLQLHFYRLKSWVRGRLRLENLNPAETDDLGQPQCNDYGSPGSLSFDDLTLVVAGNGPAVYTIPAGELGGEGEAGGAYGNRVAVVQESSGTDGWDHLLGEAPRLQSGVAQRPSSITVDGVPGSGPDRFGGWLDARGVAVAVDRCWQNFPKAFRATAAGVELGLFPGEYSLHHELRAGEYKTHEFLIHYHENADAGFPAVARAFQAPLKAVPPAEHVAGTRGLGLMAPRVEGNPLTEDYEDYIDYMLVQSPDWSGYEYPWPTLLASIDNFNHYGWADYGDQPTDFEAVSDRVASPYNLKYDGGRGMFLSFLRTGNETWWELATAGARHFADADILHATPRGLEAERRWFEGGAYGHGYHDERGNVNPHRNYMNPHPMMSFGAPALFDHYFLTGDRLVLDAALELAENIYWRVTNSSYWDAEPCAAWLRECDAEAGECLGWAEFFWGREGGNALKSWLHAWQATGEPRYLEVIGRCASYMRCYDAQVGPIDDCDRFHMRCTFIHWLGEYILHRRLLGLPEDEDALWVLRSQIDYMTGTLWDAENGWFRMCDEGGPLYDFHNNWLLVVADAFALGSLILGEPELFSDYALPCFLDGSANPFCPGCDFAYNSAKEFVNGVGFGQPFLYALRRPLEAALVAGPGPGSANPPLVRLFDALDPGWLYAEFPAYDAPHYGVNVVLAEIDGQPGPEVLTGPGPGPMFGPRVRAFTPEGAPLAGEAVDFLAYGTHRFGVNVAAGDLDGDGIEEIVTGPGPGAIFGPHVRGWNYDGAAVAPLPGLSFLAYGTHRFGVNVACGDLDGDGIEEIVTGPGPGAIFGPHVRGWDYDGAAVTPLAGVSFMAYGTHRFGVRVACGDLDGDGIEEIVTGPGPGGMFGPHVRGWGYDGITTAPLPGLSFLAYETPRFGVVPACGDVDLDGAAEILTAPGPSPLFGCRIRGWNYDGTAVSPVPGFDFFAFDPAVYGHGGRVSGGPM